MKLTDLWNSFVFQMAIVFHEGAVKDCEPPCVAQTFVPHDALLFKVFVVGSKYFVVERPSLKNFEAAGNLFTNLSRKYLTSLNILYYS